MVDRMIVGCSACIGNALNAHLRRERVQQHLLTGQKWRQCRPILTATERERESCAGTRMRTPFLKSREEVFRVHGGWYCLNTLPTHFGRLSGCQ